MKYYDGGVVLHQSELIPLFGIVRDIFVYHNQFYFGCNVLHTICFNSHFHAYEVSSSKESILNLLIPMFSPFIHFHLSPHVSYQ